MANTGIIPDTNPTQNPKLGYESVKKKRKRKRGKKEDEKLCSGEMNEKVESGGEEKEFVGTKEVEHDNEVEQGDEVEEEKKIKKKKVKSGSGMMSSVTFESMSLSEPTMKAIKDMGFHYTTEVSNSNTFFLMFCNTLLVLTVCENDEFDSKVFTFLLLSCNM